MPKPSLQKTEQSGEQSGEQSVTVEGRAKINLHLKVLAREASGYHGIETVFQKLELSDTVRLTLRAPGDRTVECSVDVGPQETNLAFRAAQAFCHQTNWDTGFHIHITKRIPIGGGLGGGSTDAAATLRALNALSPSPMTDDDLLEIAGTLGADVPFLTSPTTIAFAWNRGDRMLELDPLPHKYVVLAIPGFGIQTGEAYQRLNIINNDASHTSHQTPTLLSREQFNSWNSLASWATNDFTPGTIVPYPPIEHAIATLRDAGAILANMTGSGSVVFGIFDPLPEASVMREIARATGCRIEVTSTAQRS